MRWPRSSKAIFGHHRMPAGSIFESPTEIDTLEGDTRSSTSRRTRSRGGRSWGRCSKQSRTLPRRPLYSSQNASMRGVEYLNWERLDKRCCKKRERKKGYPNVGSMQLTRRPNSNNWRAPSWRCECPSSPSTGHDFCPFPSIFPRYGPVSRISARLRPFSIQKAN